MSHSLSIIVPVYNEERTLVSIMTALAEKCSDAQIVYVDDGSADRSKTILHSYARAQDTVISKKNGGKGSAIREGLLHANGTHTVIQDADLEYDPTDILKLFAEAQKYPGSAIFGSRFLQDNPNIYRIFLLGNKTLTAWLNLLFGSRLTDSYTCYKLLPTDLFRSLELTSRGFEMEAEICGKCLRRGIPIRELPISYRPRTIEEGKKIGWKDAFKGVTMMWRMRWL